MAIDQWPPEPLKPREPFREVCWRLVGPSNRVIECVIVRIVTGFEVRAGYGPDDILQTRLTQDLEAARALAAEFKAAALALGGFQELGNAR